MHDPTVPIAPRQFTASIFAAVALFLTGQSAAETTEKGATHFATIVLLVLVHVLVIATIILMIVVVINILRRETDSLERLLLSASVAAGFLAYTASRALGISIPTLMSSSLATSSPFGIAALGVVFPSAAGTFVAWFCLRMIKKHLDIATRGALLLTTFIITMFCDVYAALAGEIGVTNGRYALPNITFVLGIVVYTIFTYRRDDKTEKAI